MKKLRFWGFDFIYGCFWVWGDVAKMNLLLKWRKASPLDPKFFLLSFIFTKLYFAFIEVRETLSFFYA